MKNKYILRSARKRHNRISMILVTIVLVLLTVVVSVGKYNLRQRKAEYDKRKAQLEQQISEEEERSTEIAEYEKYTKTKKFAEETAKEKLGLVNEDEIVFKNESEE